MSAATDLGNLLAVLDATSIDDASAELGNLLRLAENAVDELGLLSACTDGFPGDLGTLFDRAARLVEEATGELRALHRGLGR